MSFLPSDGAALLGFKRRAEAPAELRYGRAAVALDDPTTRLAELEGFDELDDGAPADEDEVRAALAAASASSALRAACTPAADLAPWFEAMERILDAPDVCDARGSQMCAAGMRMMSRHRMGCICEQRLKLRPCRRAVLQHMHVPRLRLGKTVVRRIRPRAGPRADSV